MLVVLVVMEDILLQKHIRKPRMKYNRCVLFPPDIKKKNRVESHPSENQIWAINYMQYEHM